jgi:hypothetical protein
MKAAGTLALGVANMNIDLEQEFQLLMRVVIKQINDKITTGELTEPEASQLINMVNERTYNPSDPYANDHSSSDDGWRQSEDCYED